MRDWILVPCLVALRNEFNATAPGRDKGADGSIGDSHHTSSSDHTPDEESDILRDHDADDKNEVHALDIDSSGPWPDGPQWFDDAIHAIVERHRTGKDDRLQYVIWNRKIASRSSEWVWRTYTSTTDPHINHAHFSSRYTTAQENDTSSWGVYQEDDMELNDLIKLSDGAKKELGGSYATSGTVSVETALNLLLIQATRSGKNTGAILDKFAPIIDEGASVSDKAAALRVLLGDKAVEVGKLLAG